MSASDRTTHVNVAAAPVAPAAVAGFRALGRTTGWLRSGSVAIVGMVLLVAWALASLAAHALPGPADTAQELWRMANSGELWSIVGRITLFMGGCFLVATVGGVGLGLLLGAHRWLDRGLSPYLAALQGMPTSMWIPVAAIALGTSPWSLAAVVTIGAMPAIMLSTRGAVKNVPPLLTRAGRTFGASRGTLVRHVVMPAALPGIVMGLELGWSIAFRCLVAGEIFSGALGGTGIGQVIQRSRLSGDLTEMTATIVIVLAFSILVDRLVFARVQHRLRISRGLVASGLPH